MSWKLEELFETMGHEHFCSRCLKKRLVLIMKLQGTKFCLSAFPSKSSEMPVQRYPSQIEQKQV